MEIKHLTNYQLYKTKLFSYSIYTSFIADIHIINLLNYTIKLEFYPVNCWILTAKYYKYKYCSSFYLPTLNISIYSNKEL